MNENNSANTVLIFGQGPVIDAETRERAETVGNSPEQAAISFWSEDLAKAAAVLHHKNGNIKFVVMGGKTGGDLYTSEASLIKNSMIKAGINATNIETEDASKDTIENIINYINMIDSQHEVETKLVDVLGSPYHVTRLRVLLKLFNVPHETVFRSDSLLRYQAQQLVDHSQLMDTVSNRVQLETIDLLDQKNDLNAARSQLGFYAHQQGTEKRDVQDRFITDDVLIRELMTYPEKWLSQAAKINSDMRLQSIINNAIKWYGKDLLEEHLGFNIDEQIDFSEIREALSKIQYSGIPIEEFDSMKEHNTSEAWPSNTLDRLKRILSNNPS